MTVLVIDVGTSGVRAAVVRPDASVAADRYERVLPSSPFPGLVEFDPVVLADTAVRLANDVLAAAGPVSSVGVATQRASAVVWDRATGEPVGSGIGWQDLRTVGDCLTLQGQGLRLAPNQTATKVAHLLDQVDPERTRDLCVGTVDSWLVWRLTAGERHVTDLTNAAVTGLLVPDASGWDDHVLEVLRIPRAALPDLVDSAGFVGHAQVLAGIPPITGLVGDQQASLVGQAGVRPGRAKVTFGTGAMLDVWVGPDRPAFPSRGPAGTFPIVTARIGGQLTWGVEAIMLSAGSNVEWLCDDLGLIGSAAESHDVAAACADTGGVVFVPALLGLGTPHWDYGARGTLLGATRGTGRAELVRAVLEGVAQRGADLVEAAESDAAVAIEVLRVDCGMSANPTFVQALADAAQRPVELSPVLEATTLGAAFLAGIGTGAIDGLDALDELWSPRAVVEPAGPTDRDRWREAVERARGWHGDLSALDF